MESSGNPQQITPSPETADVDQFKLQHLLQQIRDNQSLGMGLLAGAGAACLGAVVWAVITALTSYQIGFMAIGVGFLVGYAVQYFGKGIDKQFGVAGAVLSLLGCLAGNLFTVCIVVSQQESVPLSQILQSLTPDIAVNLLVDTFSPMDVLFYGIAVYYGYRYSFRKLTTEEIASVTKRT